jgi:hypothetical protein
MLFPAFRVPVEPCTNGLQPMPNTKPMRNRGTAGTYQCENELAVERSGNGIENSHSEVAQSDGKSGRRVDPHSSRDQFWTARCKLGGAMIGVFVDGRGFINTNGQGGTVVRMAQANPPR